MVKGGLIILTKWSQGPIGGWLEIGCWLFVVYHVNIGASMFTKNTRIWIMMELWEYLESLEDLQGVIKEQWLQEIYDTFQLDILSTWEKWIFRKMALDGVHMCPFWHDGSSFHIMEFNYHLVGGSKLNTKSNIMGFCSTDFYGNSLFHYGCNHEPCPTPLSLWVAFSVDDGRGLWWFSSIYTNCFSYVALSMQLRLRRDLSRQLEHQHLNFECLPESFEPMIEPIILVHMESIKGGDKEKGESLLHQRDSGRVMRGTLAHHPLTWAESTTKLVVNQFLP